MASRRRSYTATKPAAPPPNVPMLPLPDSPEIPHQQPRTIHKDLEDSPPPSVFHTRPPPDDPPDPKKESDHIAPEPRHDPRIPSSRRALTRALELAREAVQLDSTNEEPEAAIMAYGRSVALLSQVMERVRRGEDSTESRRRNGRPRSAVAQEEEVRRLQNIHDTYADRMNILSIINHIPPIPYSVTNEYAAMAQESSSHSAGSALLSPTSDPSLHIPPPGYTSSTLDDHPELPSHIDPLLDRDSQDPALSLFDSDRAPPEHISHSYAAARYDGPPALPQPQPLSIFRPHRRRNTSAAALAPPQPPPANSLPPAPIPISVAAHVAVPAAVPIPAPIPAEQEPPSTSSRMLGPREAPTHRHANSASRLALEEEVIREEVPCPPEHLGESPPLPPLPSPTTARQSTVLPKAADLLLMKQGWTVPARTSSAEVQEIATDSELNNSNTGQIEGFPRVAGPTNGPLLYEAVTVATSVIYWPENTNEVSPDPRPSDSDLTTAFHSCGGTILSVFQPTTSLAWLEANYDSPLVKSIYSQDNYNGPFAMMLFPDTPALAIYGPHTEQSMAVLAKTLANESKFPVISQPTEHSPMLRLQAFGGVEKDQMTDLKNQDEILAPNSSRMRKNDRVMLGGEGVDAGGPSVPTAGPPQIGLDGDPSEPNQDPTRNLARPQDDPNLDGETDDSSEPSEHDSDNYQDTVSIQGETEGDKKNHNVPYFQGGGGGGDPDDSGGNGGTDINGPWKEWESPIHLTKSTIELQLPNTTVKLSITSHTQFNTYPNGRDPEDVGRPFHQRKMYRPQAQAHTVLEVARGVWAPDIAIDRSYVVLGLQAHRPNSILRSENLDCDFSAPSQIYKNALSKNTVKTLAASLGGVNFGAPPTLGVTTTYSKAETRMKEATDTKPMPQWVATHQVGSVEEIGQTSFASVDYSYELAQILSPKSPQPDLKVEFAMGINFFGEHEQNPPEVSSITRHQILVWVSDSSLRSKIRGLQVLIANELPSIRRESPICKTENLEVDLKTDPLSLVPTSKSVGDDTAGAFSSVLIEKKNKSIFNQVRDTAKALLKYKPSLPQVTLTPHEGVSRGWDVNNYRWRNAIFPDLDQDFRRANNSSLIAFSISPLPHPK